MYFVYEMASSLMKITKTVEHKVNMMSFLLQIHNVVGHSTKQVQTMEASTKCGSGFIQFVQTYKLGDMHGRQSSWSKLLPSWNTFIGLILLHFMLYLITDRQEYIVFHKLCFACLLRTMCSSIIVHCLMPQCFSVHCVPRSLYIVSCCSVSVYIVFCRKE